MELLVASFCTFPRRLLRYYQVFSWDGLSWGHIFLSQDFLWFLGNEKDTIRTFVDKQY